MEPAEKLALASSALEASVKFSAEIIDHVNMRRFTGGVTITTPGMIHMARVRIEAMQAYIEMLAKEVE